MAGIRPRFYQLPPRYSRGNPLPVVRPVDRRPEDVVDTFAGVRKVSRVQPEGREFVRLVPAKWNYKLFPLGSA